MSTQLPEEVQQRLRELEKELNDGKRLERWVKKKSAFDADFGGLQGSLGCIGGA